MSKQILRKAFFKIVNMYDATLNPVYEKISPNEISFNRSKEILYPLIAKELNYPAKKIKFQTSLFNAGWVNISNIITKAYAQLGKSLSDQDVADILECFDNTYPLYSVGALTETFQKYYNTNLKDTKTDAKLLKTRWELAKLQYQDTTKEQIIH